MEHNIAINHTDKEKEKVRDSIPGVSLSGSHTY